MGEREQTWGNVPEFVSKSTKKGTNAGEREQTWGNVPEFVSKIGQKGNKRGGMGTNVGAPTCLCA